MSDVIVTSQSGNDHDLTMRSGQGHTYIGQCGFTDYVLKKHND
jgi:hypothetical protein